MLKIFKKKQIFTTYLGLYKTLLGVARPARAATNAQPAAGIPLNMRPRMT